MAQGRILVVDDEVDLLEILSEFLTDKGFTVVTAHSRRSRRARPSTWSFPTSICRA